MANIAVLHNSALSAGTTTSSGIGTGSSVTYLSDNRLSFKYTTAGSEDTIELDQDSANVITFTDLAISDHNLAGSTITLTSYTDAGRGSPTVEVNAQEIPNEDPFVLSLSAFTDFANVDIDIAVSGSNTASVGELGLYERFASPIRPGIGIRTNEIPRTTFILLANGERQSIAHGGVIRNKTYTIGGLSIAQANEWVAVFTNNAGAQLVILDDERDDTYPCMMQQEMTINDTVNILSVNLDFMELKLS